MQKRAPKKLISKLTNIIVFMITISIIGIIYNTIKADRLKNSDLSPQIEARIKQKIAYLDQKAYEYYGIRLNIPIKLIDDVPQRIWGMMVYTEQGPQKIVVNRVQLKESPNYIIENVLPHEWAHAIERILHGTKDREGHGEAWLKICNQLSKNRCQRYVHTEKVATEKLHHYFSF
jgi:SprT protein